MAKRIHPKGTHPKPAHAVLPTREAVLAFIEESPQKVGKREIAQAFGIKGSDKIELKRLIKEMQEDGAIEKDRAGLRKAGRLPPVVVADIDSRRDRDGELVARPAQWDPEAGPAPLITVLMPRGGRRTNGPAPGTGDRALLKIEPDGDAPGRYIGRVIKVIGRNKAETLGVFRALPAGAGGSCPSTRRRRGARSRCRRAGRAMPSTATSSP